VTDAPVQERAQRTRERILEVAALAFAEHGYEGTSLNALIRESGLTKGAFYFHFASKEALALAAFRRKQEQLIEGLVAQAGEQGDAVAQLAEMLRARARLLQEDRSLHCVLTLGAELGPRFGPGSESAGYQETALELLDRLVRRGQQEGVFRAELEPGRTAETLFAAVLGIDFVSDLLADRADLVQRSEDLVALLTHGLVSRS
jgi:AcrR family transcriptional regulator